MEDCIRISANHLAVILDLYDTIGHADTVYKPCQAMTCPHCGAPVLCVGLPANNKFASVLRTLSGICFFGGLLLSVFGARVPTISGNTVYSVSVIRH